MFQQFGLRYVFEIVEGSTVAIGALP